MLAGCNSPAMLSEIYIEALLVDEELSGQVWNAWDCGEFDDLTAYETWSLLSGHSMLYLA